MTRLSPRQTRALSLLAHIATCTTKQQDPTKQKLDEELLRTLTRLGLIDGTTATPAGYAELAAHNQPVKQRPAPPPEPPPITWTRFTILETIDDYNRRGLAPTMTMVVLCIFDNTYTADQHAWVYAQIKELIRLGLLEPRGQSRRHLHRLTDNGKAELETWQAGQ